MSDCSALPAQCARLVIVDGLNHTGAALACAMAVSPLTRHVTSIVLVDAVDERTYTPATTTTATAATKPNNRNDTASVLHTRCAATQAVVSAIAEGMHRSRLPSSHLPYQYYYDTVHATAAQLPALLSRIYVGPTLTPAVGQAAWAMSRQLAFQSPHTSPTAAQTQTETTTTTITTTSSRSRPKEQMKKSFVPDWRGDVFVVVCCGDAGTSQDVTEPLTRLLHSAHAHHTPASPRPLRVTPGLMQRQPQPQPPHVEDDEEVAACRFLVLVDAASRTNVELYLCSPAVQALVPPRWLVVLVAVPAFAPPALDFGATQAAVCAGQGDVLVGLLPGLCAGVATGLIQRLEVARHCCAPIAPLDVVANVGLLLLARQLSPQEEENFNNNNKITKRVREKIAPPCALRVVSLEMTLPCEEALAWVMVGEYILDYYGCYAKDLRECAPLRPWLCACPTLHFPVSLGDTVRWGPDAGPGLSWFAPRHARQRRAALLTNTSSSSSSSSSVLLQSVSSEEGGRAEEQQQQQQGNNNNNNNTRKEMQAKVEELVACVDGVARRASWLSSAEYNNNNNNNDNNTSGEKMRAALPHMTGDDAGVSWHEESYGELLSQLAAMSSRSMASLLLQYVALYEVDWNMYTVTVAQSVLAVLAAMREPTLGSAPARIAFCHALPPIVPSFINGIVFRGPGRLPRHPSLWRRCLGNVDWVYRLGMCPNGRRAPMRPGLTRETLQDILRRPTVQRVLAGVAQEEGVEPATVEERAKAVLHGIGDTQNQLQIKFAGYVMRTIFEKIFRRIAINPGTHERLRRLFARPRTAVVVLPLHRSYFDFLVINYYLGVACLPSPHIASGEDFLHMGKVAELMRGCGAFFMRRSFHKDLLYTTLFQEYVRQLVLRRRCVEFFIEGTRSRTGKTMVPRLGILKFIMNAFLDPTQRALDDVLLLPMSVSYDELPELAIYADELLGLPKPRETLRNLAKVRASLNHDYGAVNLHVAEAISLREYCRAHAAAAPTTPARPSSSSASSAAAPHARHAGASALVPMAAQPVTLLQSLGYHITRVLQQNIVITPTALVAAAVECLWPYTRRGLPLLVTAAAAAVMPAGHQADTAEHYTSVRSNNNNNNNNNNSEEHEQRFTRGVRGVLSRVRVTAVVRWLRHAIRQREGNLSCELDMNDGSREGGNNNNNGAEDVDRVVDEGLRHLARFLHVETREKTGRAVVVMPRPTLSAHVALSICANQLIHVFVDEAVVAVIARAHGVHTRNATRPGDGVKEEEDAAALVVVATEEEEEEDVVDPSALFTRAKTTRALCVPKEVLRAEARLLCGLLASEFPGFATGAQHLCFEAWLSTTLGKLQGGDAPVAHKEGRGRSAVLRLLQHASGSSRHTSSAHGTAGGFCIPAGNLYDFVLQLLLPHIEALYIVLATMHVLRATYQAAPLPVSCVVTAAHKATLALCSMSPPQLDFAVLCCKETLSHYLTSLVQHVAGLRLDPCCAAAAQRPAFVVSPTTTSTPTSDTSSSNSNTNDADKEGVVETLAALQALLLRINALRWHVSADVTADLTTLRRPVLQYYMEAMERAKL